jgi:hypothetical protein
VLASLEERKSGESRRVLWRLHRKHLPPYAVHSSYIFGLLLLIFRRLTRS